jgi:hypothetical protein
MPRRTLLAIACATVLIATAAHAGNSSSTLTVKPSEMKDGETKTIVEDGKTITVRRDGDTTHVKIEGAGTTEALTITREEGQITIGREEGGGRRTLVVGPERERIVIRGLDLDELDMPRFRALPERGPQTFFVCPKDKTTLRVPKENSEQEFKCPVDGTPMERRKGHGFTFYFDDSSIEL